jgi:hypothetical protein
LEFGTAEQQNQPLKTKSVFLYLRTLFLYFPFAKSVTAASC